MEQAVIKECRPDRLAVEFQDFPTLPSTVRTDGKWMRNRDVPDGIPRLRERWQCGADAVSGGRVIRSGVLRLSGGAQGRVRASFR